MGSALVIENDPSNDLRRLGEWLAEAGLPTQVHRPYADDPVPADPAGHAAVIVLGGRHRADEPDPAAPWLPAVEGLLRKAVRQRIPTLAIGLGAQLLATAHAGTVERSAAGPEIGPALVGKRDAAGTDPLFRYVPLAPDVLQWHVHEITELPHGAVLLAASTHYPHQAFRLGDRAWGLQFHIECDRDMISTWASGSTILAELRLPADVVVDACVEVLGEIEDVWQPFAARFAALALGQLPGSDDIRRTLPLLGG
ncbi:type 1 glutamine amidotransferase [Micromonospora sp. NBC_01813]|uniref:type 1 glutamine amidotransferase n=1 Tax=Micromonospora sp. NBC_01813 TaxID=2975988 RepID=UPI002DDC4E59|nr:type 1 glutamine amidotransferase [Micromonospora sp. NBC_01813]WSA09521.1 type 1 glutamine amidotransferase [Micromonospora sp. NBC_01813]